MNRRIVEAQISAGRGALLLIDIYVAVVIGASLSIPPAQVSTRAACRSPANEKSANEESADMDFTNGAAIRNEAASIVSKALFHFRAKVPESCSRPIYIPPEKCSAAIHASHSTGGVR